MKTDRIFSAMRFAFLTGAVLISLAGREAVAGVDSSQARERAVRQADSGSEESLTPLMLAVDRSDVAEAQALLDRGEDVNARTNSGLTALMIVARR